MIYALIASLFLLLATPPPANAQYFGKFTGMANVEFLPDGRGMRLTKDFSYTDPAGGTWMAPAGSVVDGASIPKFAWSLIGGPFEGKYRDASVIHDIACIKKDRPWELVHLAFYNAMLASGVDRTSARIMYAAVYHFGPRWKYTEKITAGAEKEEQIRYLERESARYSQLIVNEEVKKICPTPLNCKVQTTVEVTVTPPKYQLTEDQFKILEELIKERKLERLTEERTLEAIRSFPYSDS